MRFILKVSHDGDVRRKTFDAALCLESGMRSRATQSHSQSMWRHCENQMGTMATKASNSGNPRGEVNHHGSTYNVNITIINLLPSESQLTIMNLRP